MNRLLRGSVAVALATLVWLPTVHLVFEGEADADGRARTRDALTEAQLAMVEDPAAREAALARMRSANAEWDFMGRTFVVLSLANRALEVPADRDRALEAMDFLIAETLRLEDERGQDHFLMDYVHAGRFRDPSGRSVFVDGEIALMLAARQRVEPTELWREALAERVDIVAGQLGRGPMRSAESYPDECWTFCNTVALAAIRVSDAVTGDDHTALLTGWVANAREHLVDPETGMLVSSYRYDGTHLDGPEGSSIFLAAHMLEIVDPVFARDQYERARSQLGVTFAGFGWAREWPASWEGPHDVDSGPVVPLVDASAGASGMALLGAAAFDDDAWLTALHTSLAFAAFPTEDDAGHLRYAASNQVGDAVLLYSLLVGPLWQRVGAPPPAPVAMGGL